MVCTSNAKERIFSHRDSFGQWQPKDQRPELWNLFNTRLQPGEHFRVFPISNWTELDVWQYIEREPVALPALYFSHQRQVIERHGLLVPLTEHTPAKVGEHVQTRQVRFRTVGDITCTCPVASDADVAVVLVDATKLDWQNPALSLLVQTRRHGLLCHLLRVGSIVFAINKLDAIEDLDGSAATAQAALAYSNIRSAIETFTQAVGMSVSAIVPVSALKGYNVVSAVPGWCGYAGASLLDILECLPVIELETDLPLALPVQWVEKTAAATRTGPTRRVFWGRVATGFARVGLEVKVSPSGQLAHIVQVIDHMRMPGEVLAGHSAGVVLDREVDVSRGDWLLAAPSNSAAAAGDRADRRLLAGDLLACQHMTGTVAWMDDEPLCAERVYCALHGHRWIKARIQRIVHRLNVNTLAQENADTLTANQIGHVELALQEPVALRAFAQSRVLGSMVLVDTASHKTVAAVLID